MLLEGATVFHVNVNCSDLQRSQQFYVDGLGLKIGTRTQPGEVQSGAAFGVDQALWDATILVGESGFNGGAIDLLEWKIPKPTGSTPAHINETGWQRIALMVADIDAARANALRCGGRAWSEPFDTGDVNGSPSIRLCFVTDPDGTAVELIGAGSGPRVAFFGMTCHDLERSVMFYQSLGFHEMLRIDASRPTGDHLNLNGPVAMEEVLMGAPGKGEVSLLLAGFRTPAAQPMLARPANALGAWRVAMMVDDLDAACAALLSGEISMMSDPVQMSMGPGIPDLRFVCFRGPDHEVLELIERPLG